jgi:hypothetical protein
VIKNNSGAMTLMQRELVKIFHHTNNLMLIYFSFKLRISIVLPMALSNGICSDLSNWFD